MESIIKQILTILLALSFFSSYAQTPNAKEWLAKKKTQRQYFADQMAALQTYLVVLKKGYDIADKGMGLISNSSQDESNGHYNRLLSLYATNPEVDQNSVMRRATTLQQSIDAEFTRLLDFSSSNSNLTSEEIAYVRKVYSNMTLECNGSVTELLRLFNGYSTTMNDDEKLVRISKIQSEMVEQYSFSCSFCSSTRSVATARAKEKHEITLIRDQL